MEHMKLLGQSMSSLHSALREFRTSDLPAITDEYSVILQHMQVYFSDSSVTGTLKHKLGLVIKPQKLKWLEVVVQAASMVSDQRYHALHMDFVRSNVLFERGG